MAIRRCLIINLASSRSGFRCIKLVSVNSGSSLTQLQLNDLQWKAIYLAPEFVMLIDDDESPSWKCLETYWKFIGNCAFLENTNRS